MTDKEIRRKKPFKKVKIKDNNGLEISYDKSELDEYLPHLMSEVSKSKKSLKIDSVKFKLEKESEEIQNSNKFYPEELYNPKAIDFIRRCTYDEEAIEILDYLLRRKELSSEEYKLFKNQISKKDGLKNLIEEHGGFKKPGYYERKFRVFTQQKNSEKERTNERSKTKKS
ncbi:MAG: DUF2095 family protein [Promethearchaeota archaeon]